MKSALIIDDDDGYRMLIAEALRADGWQVWDADHGDLGVELARQHHPKIIICDLLMPRGNGFQVCSILRRDPHFHTTRILVTSGRAYDTDRKAALEAGADEYLIKPFDLSALFQTLHRLINKSDTLETPAPINTANTDTHIKFWGVRGSIATPGPTTVHYGGNTSCIEIRTDGQIIILDAGTGLRLLGRALAHEFKDQPINLNILLSHTHWDHIQGLPFFQPLYRPHNHIHILGYEDARSGLFEVLSSQMESPYFPIGLKELPSNVEIHELRDLDFQLGNVCVQAFFANHPGICVGYRLNTRDGSIAFFPDNERHHFLHPTGVSHADQTKRNAFAEDKLRQFIEFLRDVDVLILDAQYDHEEYQEHVGWGHGCVDDVVQIAVAASAKQLFLFHHDPDHDDEKITAMVAHARQVAISLNSPLQIDAAREGQVVQLTAGPGK